MKNFRESTVLIVDDEPTVRQVLSRMLEKEGFRTFSAGKCPEALKILRSEKIDLVITDLVMPEMSGERLIRLAKEEFPHVRFIRISGCHPADAAPDDRTPFLEKPFGRASLIRHVNTLLAAP